MISVPAVQCLLQMTHLPCTNFLWHHYTPFHAACTHNRVTANIFLTNATRRHNHLPFFILSLDASQYSYITMLHNNDLGNISKANYMNVAYKRMIITLRTLCWLRLHFCGTTYQPSASLALRTPRLFSNASVSFNLPFTAYKQHSFYAE